MQIHEIQREHENIRSYQIGRGGRRGKTSGRGHKGQKARAGHKIRPQIRDEMKRIPKWRGRGNNKQKSIQDKPAVINVATIEAMFESGTEITPQVLFEQGMIDTRGGSLPSVKVLGNGDIAKKVTVSGCLVSGSARDKIENAGGTVS